MRRSGVAIRYGACVALTALAALSPLAAPPAHAFNFFGLFGSDNEPPKPDPKILPYELTFELGDADDLKTPLRDASGLYRLQSDAPADGDVLVRRAKADITAVMDAEWGAGYYNAAPSIEVAGVPITLSTGENGLAAAQRAAEGYRNRALVPVKIIANPGPQFTFREIHVVDAQTGAPFSAIELPRRVIKLEPGEPAKAADILAAEARIVDEFRSQARPFARVVKRNPVVFHDSHVMDVTIAVERGPVAGIGDITLSGLKELDPRVVRSFIYTERGTPYSPQELRDMRKSITRVEAVSGVRIREGKKLDAEGNLPLDIELTERKKHVIGGAASYSTIDGPAISTYWANRNLFGGGERLRLDAALFFAQRGTSAGLPDFSRFSWDDLGGRVKASFLKPALKGSRNDFLFDATVAREATEGYLANYANATAALRHRWSDTISAQIGLEFEKGHTTDELGKVDYTLVGIPVSATYDSTDSDLDPTKGWRITAGVTPYPTFLGSSVGFVASQASASTYWSLDEESRYILAGRVGFGSIVGAELEDIPANRRFFAGGGGSVRGYRYRSLGPQFDGEPIGGRSLLEASVEARIHITDTIGVVPFLDAGTAFDKSYPDFDSSIKLAAGLGLRYYTGIGPIRVDVAIPINPGHGDPSYALYFGIGQAF